MASGKSRSGRQRPLRVRMRISPSLLSPVRRFESCRTPHFPERAGCAAGPSKPSLPSSTLGHGSTSLLVVQRIRRCPAKAESARSNRAEEATSVRSRRGQAQILVEEGQDTPSAAQDARVSWEQVVQNGGCMTLPAHLPRPSAKGCDRKTKRDGALQVAGLDGCRDLDKILPTGRKLQAHVVQWLRRLLAKQGTRVQFPPRAPLRGPKMPVRLRPPRRRGVD